MAEQGLGSAQKADNEDAWQRLTTYSYLSARERLEYIEIMRVFCATLLTDLSVADVLAKLQGTTGTAAGLDSDQLTARLEQLTEWGNLLRSSHTLTASSIREYQRARSRYQLSKLGERIQRDADEVLAGADAAREVSSELLALVERGLRELAELVQQPGGANPQEALERISTLFVQFTEFADSIRDFYAYLGQVLARYDLDSGEYQGFKDLLLDYVEAITDEVSFRAPRIASTLDALWPELPGLLERIDAVSGGLSGAVEGLPETRVQRSRGRELTDWEGLRGWFTDADGKGSQVDQLRDATMRALQSLLANAKRMLRSASGEMSRRKDLLKLARWFDEAAPEDAHDIAVSAFGMYSTRHLGVPPEIDEAVPAYTSWWTGPVVEVPVALRERGSRAQRGRTSSVEDHAEQKQRLRQEAREHAAARQAAADELCSASGNFARVRLTSPALALLLELLASALGNAQLLQGEEGGLDEVGGFGLESAWTEDAELGIQLTVRRLPDISTVLHSVDGDLALEELDLSIERLLGAVPGESQTGGERIMTVPSAHDVALAAERRSAARLLLAHPLAKAKGPHADLFPLIRRHAEWLTHRFQLVLGYQLLVDTAYARLFKAGLGYRSGNRLIRSTGTPFTPRTYACLALALSVLVTAPEQMLLSRLVADLKAAAADAGIELEGTGRQAEKRTLAAALRQLVDWGALIEIQGNVNAVAQEDTGEALLTVDREIARTLVSGPLTQSRDGADLVRRSADPGFGGPRTYVRRMLVETPAVYLDELTDSERDWLRTRQRRESQAFSELLGMEAEIRAEGIVLVDPEEELTDLRLPGTGTIAQASLLLVEQLVDRLRPEKPGHPATGGELVVGVPIPEGLVERILAELVEEYGRRCNWTRDYVDDIPELRDAALDLLARMRLVAPRHPLRSEGEGLPQTYQDAVPEGRSVTDVSAARGTGNGWVLLAAASRYSPASP